MTRFHGRKIEIPTFFETLWYYKFVSGFFDLFRHSLRDVYSQYIFIEAGMVTTAKRFEFGSGTLDLFCYIKKETGRIYSKYGTISKKLRKDVLDHYGYKCYYCGVKLTRESSDTEIHHHIPYIIGGNTNLQNLRPTCLSCHKSMPFWKQYWKKNLRTRNNASAQAYGQVPSCM